jgi:hypothetical protein
MAINQLTTANTFEQWLSATQNLIATANTLTDGNGATFVANTKLDVSGTGSTLNVRTSGSINVLYSNTAFLTDANISILNYTTANGNTITAMDITATNSANIQLITGQAVQQINDAAVAFSIALG